MIEHVLDALRPQVGPLLINANRNLDRYAAYGHPVVSDTLRGFPGTAGRRARRACSSLQPNSW